METFSANKQRSWECKDSRHVLSPLIEGAPPVILMISAIISSFMSLLRILILCPLPTSSPLETSSAMTGSLPCRHGVWLKKQRSSEACEATVHLARPVLLDRLCKAGDSAAFQGEQASDGRCAARCSMHRRAALRRCGGGGAAVRFAWLRCGAAAARRGRGGERTGVRHTLKPLKPPA